MKGITTTVLTLLLCSGSVFALPAANPVARANKPVFKGTIPQHKDKLPLFTLGKEKRFPERKFQKILSAAAPGAKLTKQTAPDGSELYYDGDLLVGVYDTTTGGSHVYPKLSALKPVSNIDTQPGLNDILNDPEAIPKDDTHHKIVKGITLGASQKKVDGAASPPQDFLIEGLIKRNVAYEQGSFAVCGPGTRGKFKFGAGGEVKGMSHKQKDAKKSREDIPPLSQKEIQAKVEEQLAEANINNAVVNTVELCFYDSGAKFIQPVFKFEATVANGNGLADTLFVGYVPAGGKEQEPLPTIKNPSAQAQPSVSTNSTDNRPITTKDKRLVPIKVGRYAMSNDQFSPQIVVDENALLSGLTSVSSSFVNSQYYWDEPYHYTTSSMSYINSVNLAMTEGHGNVHLFTTNEKLTNWGPIYIDSSIPAKGYGPAAGVGGSLAYWIIRACRTVSTPLEYSAANIHLAFDPWWKVFNGMHAVLGYRSDAAVYDNSMGAVGKTLAQGASVVHGWMNAASPGGKTSAVVACGHDDDNVYNIANIGKATCLTIWYLY